MIELDNIYPWKKVNSDTCHMNNADLFLNVMYTLVELDLLGSHYDIFWLNLVLLDPDQHSQII